MYRTKTVAIAALGLMLVTAGCLSGVGAIGSNSVDSSAPDQSAQTTAGTKTIQVASSGQVTTAPNRVVIRVGVVAQANNVEDVRARLAANVSSIKTALEEAGLSKDQYHTAEYDISRNHEYKEEPNAKRFRGHHAITITLNNTDRAGEIIVTAVQNGATEIDNVQFTISQDRRQKLRQQAVKKAVTNARGQAEAAASSAELTITGVDSVRTASFNVAPYESPDVAFKLASGGGGATTSLSGGQVTVSVRVQVTFNASNT